MCRVYASKHSAVSSPSGPMLCAKLHRASTMCVCVVMPCTCSALHDHCGCKQFIRGGISQPIMGRGARKQKGLATVLSRRLQNNMPSNMFPTMANYRTTRCFHKSIVRRYLCVVFILLATLKGIVTGTAL
eukprot:868131-Amphidinium_carterae.1